MSCDIALWWVLLTSNETAANAAYAAFGQSMKDTGHASQEDNIAFLEDGLVATGEPSSEMEVDEQHDSDGQDERPRHRQAGRVSGMASRRGKTVADWPLLQRNRTPSDQYLEIQEMVQSSPVLANQPRTKPRIASLFTKVASKMAATVTTTRSSAQAEFDDIDVCWIALGLYRIPS